MDDELALHLAQRAVLLASDDADLAQLKSHDRKLLAAMDLHNYTAPMTHRRGADEALVEALETDSENALLILEARARLWPGELGRVQQLLLPKPGCVGAAWWLAAHYPSLPCPLGFPEDWPGQLWAAKALWRRDSSEFLPEPWQRWGQALDGTGPVGLATQNLWGASGAEFLEDWLAPLLAVADQDTAASLINWVAARVEDKVVIRLMGLSCQSRFLPWLASMRHNADLTEVALREVRWLTGTRQQRHVGLQCWGEPMSSDNWPVLFQSLPLGYRRRLWHWCGRRLEGASTSLQGGQWCAGS